MYKEMAAVAREEGFTEIAIKFELVGKIEKEHEERYLALLEKVKADTSDKRQTTDLTPRSA